MTVEFEGDPLATREMVWLDADDNAFSAFVDIGFPQFVEPQEDGDSPCWKCAVRLRDFGDETVRLAYGEDAIQAIYMALILAGVSVARLPLAQRTDYVEVPNYGFPSVGDLQISAKGNCNCH